MFHVPVYNDEKKRSVGRWHEREGTYCQNLGWISKRQPMARLYYSTVLPEPYVFDMKLTLESF